MRQTTRLSVLLVLVMVLTSYLDAAAQPKLMPRRETWVATWAASAHGPYPSGNASAQPILDFAFESPEHGAVDQTFRLIVKPDVWGRRIRLRFSNAFGTQRVTFDDVHVGVQGSGGNILTGTNQPAAFDRGRKSITIAPGASAFSDPIDLPIGAHGELRLLAGRKLAVSFHVVGATGPMTWHAKALTTSYLSAPHAGSHGAEESDASFPYTTTSWYFLDAIEVEAPEHSAVVVCFGDSITDGTNSTLNGDDRWPDVLSRRLHAAFGDRVSVVNAGIGGNQILGPVAYSATAPFSGGPSALSRLERDVLSLSGVTSVVWLEGINDLSAGASAEAVIAGLKEGVRRLRARGVRVIGGTITSSVGATTASGTPENDVKRKAINEFIRTGGLFDGVADFDAATRDPQTGGLKDAFQPNSTTGGAGDRLHPNRAGYHAMGNAVDLALLVPGRHK